MRLSETSQKGRRENQSRGECVHSTVYIDIYIDIHLCENVFVRLRIMHNEYTPVFKKGEWSFKGN